MRQSFQALAVAASLTTFFWIGCSDDSGETDTTSSSSSLGSTGTQMSTGTSSSTSMVTSNAVSSGTGMVEMSECNPVTNEPCDTAGEVACDAATNNSFVCFPPPNAQQLCEPCDFEGNFCTPAHTCAPGENGVNYCAKYCCDDNDCGPQGTCQLGFPDFDLNMVGICVRDPNAGTGGGGAGGGGAGGSGGAGGMGMTNPAEATHDCAAPFPSPSMGACAQP